MRASSKREIASINMRLTDTWLSFGLAFVGGYCDAAGFVLAKTFTGHITGALVLAAIDGASREWPAFLRDILAIVFFLAGVVMILIPKRLVAGPSSRLLLPAVMGAEIVLISAGYFALSAHLAGMRGLFVSCMALAMGLQNGAFTQAGGVSVHTTYLTGLVTSLLKTEVEKHDSKLTTRDASAADRKATLLSGIWLAFVLGATIGAVLVLRFGARGLAGAASLLLAMAAGLTVSRWPVESRRMEYKKNGV